MATTGSKTQTADRDRDLTGRVALVTGGTRGIGAAICHALAADGAVVAAGYSSNRERADELRQAVEAEGGTLSLHQGNIGDAEDCERVVKEVIEQHGRLDILVNNAGITVDKPVSKMSATDWDKVLQVDLSGAFYMSKPAIAHMIDRGSGRIINISSVSGRDGQHRPGELHGLEVRPVRAHEDARPRGGAHAPRWPASSRKGSGSRSTASPRADRDRHGRHDTRHSWSRDFLEKIPAHRMGQPDEIARVVCFLAQDASGYITGQIWGVDGGIDM